LKINIKFNLFHLLIILILLVLLKICASAMYQYFNILYSLQNSELKPDLKIHTHLPSVWLIPVVLILIIGLIILFIWSSLRRYYHYSLPQELFKFLTEKRVIKGKQAKIIQALSEKIQNYYQEKNIMLTALSHDIKTPLTEAILQLELLDNPEITQDIQNKLMQINSIINSSLDYSKEPENIKKENLDLLLILKNKAESYKKAGLTIQIIPPLDSPDFLYWPIEPALFNRLIQNLLDNAKHYATEVNIILNLKNKNLILDILDNGPGVPKEALKKISTPYYRVDPSRSRNTGGMGLGLAIVKKIAEIHWGSLTLFNQHPHGFGVRLIFKPLSATSSPNHSELTKAQ